MVDFLNAYNIALKDLQHLLIYQFYFRQDGLVECHYRAAQHKRTKREKSASFSALLFKYD